MDTYRSIKIGLVLEKGFLLVAFWKGNVKFYYNFVIKKLVFYIHITLKNAGF